jgi:hypothetical protein
MLATLFGATFQLAAALAGELAQVLAPRGAGIAAGIAGLWITVGGNLHGFVYGLLKPVGVRLGWIAAPAKPYWLSDSTRFVGHDPPTADKLIHEFPAYAFYVGDLHAHLLDLPNVLSLLAVLLVWIRLARTGRDRESFVLAAVLGAGTGVLAITNAWDAAIYGTIFAVAVLATGRFGARERGARSLAMTVVAGVAGLAAVATPFVAQFVPFAAGVVWVRSRTPAWQWALSTARRSRSPSSRGGGPHNARPRHRRRMALRRRADDRRPCVRTVRRGRLREGHLRRRLVSREHRVQVRLPGVRDARARGVRRDGVAARPCRARARPMARRHRDGARDRAVPLLRVVRRVRLVRRRAAPSVDARWRALPARETRETRARSGGCARTRAGRPTIVEAVGESYTYAARMSANTGVPALLGWPMHEWLWRGVSPRATCSGTR